jgi:multicomponent Na+:H+ antiporter subunit E
MTNQNSDRRTSVDLSKSEKRIIKVVERKNRILSLIFTSVIMMAVWIILSGKLDAFHLSLGVVSSILVSFFSAEMLIPEAKLSYLLKTWVGVMLYLPWLIYQIFLCNLHLVYLVFHPRLEEVINPQIVKFKSKLEHDNALVTIANSITLTPGTNTIYLSAYGDFTVHAIDDVSAQGIPGEMETKAKKIFGL